MGEVTTTVSDLLKVPDMIALGGGAGKKAGHLCVKSAKLRHQHSFLDYVSGGTQLHCTFAIDFTGRILSLLQQWHLLIKQPSILEAV